MPNKTLTHTQCRAKVCVVCFKTHKDKDMRDISGNSDLIQVLKTNLVQNFYVLNPRIPTGLCTVCRKKYFSKKAVTENKKFVIPQYLPFVVAPENVDEPCNCAICLKVRPNGNN